MALLLDCGLRASEAIAVRWEDIDGPLALLRVRRGKGAKARIVPLTYPLLAQLRADRGPSPYLLHRTLGDRTLPVSRRTLHRIIATLGAVAGIEGCAPHRLRHTYATALLRAGLSPRDLQLCLGHADLSTTAIYLHVDPQEMAERYRRLMARPAQLTLLEEAR